LRLGLVFAKMHLQELQEVLFGQQVTRSGFQRLNDLAQDADVGEDLLAEDLFFYGGNLSLLSFSPKTTEKDSTRIIKSALEHTLRM